MKADSHVTMQVPEDSATVSSTGKAPTIKDKRCPFCRQPFTSSSLGRHLDLYIREKHPKSPDNIHNVEEIKKLRGHITRRQVRNGNRRPTPSHSKATQMRNSCSPRDINSPSMGGISDSEPLKAYLNQVNWQATGVINDLPAASPKDATMWAIGRDDSTRKQPARGGVAGKREYMNVADEGKAAQLALKEILEYIKAANQRAHPALPFEFNFFGLNLPQIYLQCLAPPPTLLAEPSRRPHELAWAIEPPSADHCELIRGWLASKLYDWRRIRQHASFGGPCAKDATHGHTSVQYEAEDMKREESAYYAHLDHAFHLWKKLPDRERHVSWHRECAQAFAREQEKHQATARRLEQVEQELQQPRMRQNSLQYPHMSDNALYQPATIPLSREAVSHLPDASKWEYTSLIAKWRNRLRSARNTQLPSTSTNPDWTPLTPNAVETDSHRPSADLENQDSWPDRGGDPDAQADEDEELADAPGDEDIEASNGRDQHLAHGRGVLDPNLRGGTMRPSTDRNGR